MHHRLEYNYSWCIGYLTIFRMLQTIVLVWGLSMSFFHRLLSIPCTQCSAHFTAGSHPSAKQKLFSMAIILLCVIRRTVLRLMRYENGKVNHERSLKFYDDDVSET